MSTVCDCCINAPYCEHRYICELEAGCDDFVGLSIRDQLIAVEEETR